MNDRRFACVIAASFAIASLSVAAVAAHAQTKPPLQQSEKSSDPAIRWQFDTHG